MGRARLPRRRAWVAFLFAACLFATTGLPAAAVHLPAGHRQVLVDPWGAGGDNFGDAVAVDGDTAVVGASADDGGGTRRGSATPFTRHPWTGVWVPSPKLIDETANDFAAFGTSVAIDGDTMVIGASLDRGTGSDQGSIHLFTRSSLGVWGSRLEIADPTPENSAYFGRSVDLDDGTIVVGAPGTGASQQGAAHVFTEVALGWLHHDLLDPFPEANDDFGASVAIDGNRILVGAPGENGDRGIVHLFTRSDGTWTHQRSFSDPDGAAGDRLGRSVAIDGPIIVAGAPGDDDAGTDGGALHAWAFEWPIGMWMHTRLPSGPLPSGAALGWSVAVESAVVVGGAPHYGGTASDQGAIHVFRGGPTTKGWTHEQTLIDPEGEDGNQLGRSVAADGEWILAGAPGESYEEIPSGVAHAFAETVGPTVDISTPADGDRFPIHTVVVADYSCDDDGAGIASCIGDVPDGTPIDTSTLGPREFSVTAFDAVGNRAEVTHTYEVVPLCEGLPVTHVAEPGEPLEGTGGPDVMLGTEGPDEISGLGGDDTICGLGGDDLILGGPGDDTLVGGDGKDKLRGAAGDDTLLGGPGSDRLLPEFGNDFVDGGPGSDIVDYLAARGPVSVNLSTGVATYTPGTTTWTHTLRAIEKADGSVYPDTLVGDDRRNVLRGKQGADTIRGLGDDDDLIGGTDDDRIFGGDGNDLVKGQANDDTLRGEAGNDKIVGGAGNDTLLGGAGNDLLIGGLRVHEGVFSNSIDGGAGTDTCRWDFDNPTNC
jgi:Ca2+-binding RTX toxin-like protein